jgi:hypothetical protein
VTHRSRYLALVALAALAVAFLLLAGAVFGGKRSSWSFGPFAGYVWRGRVSSVRASWKVPRILPGSPRGVAGTWIGAEAPGIGEHGPFIQIGVNERRAGSANSYYAFWSDTKQHFHPQYLFHLNAGDDLSASLTLARKPRRRWTLVISDTSTGKSARFSTGDEARASFNEAEWTQEDVTDGETLKPYPYPRLAKVEFRRLEVNSTAPTDADLYSTWMSVARGNLAPTPLYDDSFTLRRATVSSAGGQYLHIVTPINAANMTFGAQLARWSAKTPYAQIESASASFIAALHSGIRALASARWPARVRSLIHSLIGSARVVLGQTRPPALLTTATLVAWRSALTRAGAASSHVGQLIRRALGLPGFTAVK